MTVTLKCGCKLELPRDVQEPPVCPTHGERIVTRVTNATPRFTGSCTGPLVTK